MDQPRATLAAGMEVTPSVRLLSRLGSGGMGAVWLADHTALNTRVVVKFMLVQLDSSASARARFKREAEAASQVKSPHVVQTFDYGVTSAGLPFIVMEHLEGRDLGAEIAARGALDPATVVLIVAQVAKALAKAHAAGLLHRDIKPDNIFLCQSEGEDELFVKLLDFGIAKTHAAEGEAELDSQTKTGQVVGTPFYMSPEQVTAQKVIDLRSDLWSLGIVAFEALTGKRPYDGPSFGALAVKIATGEPPRPSEANPALPPSVDAWFAQACAREPSARFASARELAEKLRAAFEGVVSLPPVMSGMSDSGPRTPDGGAGDGAGDPAIPSLPPGPIAVDDDAHPRNSFVLASTVDPASRVDDSSLARSDGGASVAIKDDASGTAGDRRGGRRSKMRVGVPLMALVVITLAIAAGWKAKEHTSEEGTARRSTIPANAASATADTRAKASGPTIMPASSPSSSSSATVNPSPSASASASASAAAADAGVRPSSVASAHGAPPPASAVIAVSTAAGRGMPAGTSGRAPVAPSSKVADTAPKPSAKPMATTHGDPLY